MCIRDRFTASTTWFEGLIPQLRRQYAQTGSNQIRQRIEEFMSLVPCAACHGARLKPEVLAVTIADSSIYDCLLYTSDAAAERSSVDLWGRRIIKKKKNVHAVEMVSLYNDRNSPSIHTIRYITIIESQREEI